MTGESTLADRILWLLAEETQPWLVSEIAERLERSVNQVTKALWTLFDDFLACYVRAGRGRGRLAWWARCVDSPALRSRAWHLAEAHSASAQESRDVVARREAVEVVLARAVEPLTSREIARQARLGVGVSISTAHRRAARALWLLERDGLAERSVDREGRTRWRAAGAGGEK